MATIEIENARTILNKHEWNNYAWALEIKPDGTVYTSTPESANANCFCVVGAIRKANYDMETAMHWVKQNLGTKIDINKEGEKEVNEQLRAIARAIIEDEERPERELNIPVMPVDEIESWLDELDLKDELISLISDWNDSKKEKKEVMRILERALPETPKTMKLR